MTEPVRPHLAADTFDDLMHQVGRLLLDSGTHIDPGKGGATEVWGATLELRNPVARASRTETRGKFFSTLGEFCWYLAGTADGAHIHYYLSRYPDVGDDGTVAAAYGPRLFGSGGQVRRICNLLAERPDSRRAVISLFHPDDHDALQPPCTCVLQFLLRDGALNLVAYMRSNDLYLGFPHDLFAFTMIHELVARTLDVPLGSYTHVVGSLHVYDSDQEKLTTYIGEGWQATESRMPEMPPGDPWPVVEQFLEVEVMVRDGRYLDALRVDLPDYWMDLARLLAAWWLVEKSGLPDRQQRCLELREALAWPSYTWYVDELLANKGVR